MLRRLRGSAHEVITGLVVVDAQGRAWTATEVSCVVMARYPDALIERYAASGAPLDKAGGYAIQDLDGVLVDAVVGSYTNVIGLPLGVTARLLASAGVRLSAPASS
jgi:septum formation protein